jgi:hypothetical protein
LVESCAALRSGDPQFRGLLTVEGINFVDFKRIMDRAAAAGTRVENAAFSAYARTHSDSLKSVIVDETGPNGGYHLYFERDEVWLRADSKGRLDK